MKHGRHVPTTQEEEGRGTWDKQGPKEENDTVGDKKTTA